MRAWWCGRKEIDGEGINTGWHKKKYFLYARKNSRLRQAVSPIYKTGHDTSKKKNTNSEQRTEICAKEWNVFIEEKVISPVVVCEDH